MVISTNALRNIQYALFFSVSLLLGLMLNQTLYKVSLTVQIDPLNEVTFTECDGEICRTVISRR